MKLASAFALGELPYFEVRDGRIVRTEPTPAVDIHTHLALTFGRRRSVDLEGFPMRTEHYLPLDRPLDLDVYMNRNIPSDDLRACKRDLSIMSVTRHGMRRTHTAPNLLGEMRDVGVTTSVLLPIELPFLSHNADAFIETAARHAELVSFGSVHPFARGAAERLAAQQVAGARGVKLHPAVQLVRPDHPRAMALYRACADLELPVLWHCGPVEIETALGRRMSQVKLYGKAIQENPRTTFILGHSGALQVDLGLELSQRFANVYLDLSCQSLPAVRRIIAEAPIERVLFGSDWPFYHQAIGLAKVLLATEGKSTERRLVLHENAARLLSFESHADAHSRSMMVDTPWPTPTQSVASP